jgi:hypothetical protein
MTIEERFNQLVMKKQVYRWTTKDKWKYGLSLFHF